MHKTFRLLAVAGLLCVAATAVAGCSLTSVSGSEGSKNVDVTMGGHKTTDSTLDFRAVGYSNAQLQGENTASAHNLDIGPGTPITTADGTVVAKVVGVAISIPPGKIGTLALDAAPVSTRFVRVWMTESSNTCDEHGSADPRNCVGYSLEELRAGTLDSAGAFVDALPPAPGSPSG